MFTKARGFKLCILGVVVLGILGYTKGIDTSMGVASIIGAYLARRGAEGIAAVTAAGKDPEADTLEAIRTIQGKDK